MIEGGGAESGAGAYGYWAGREKAACKDYWDVLVLRKGE